MGNRKAQAALEFLTTYGWAILVILITISALYYFGIFDFTKYLPQECNFPPQFKCIDFSMIDEGGTQEIRFLLLNNIGEEVYVEGFDITNNADPPLECTGPTNTPEWVSGEEKDFVFTNCQYGVFIEGERIEAKINFTYYAPLTPSQPRHTVRGKITGTVG